MTHLVLGHGRRDSGAEKTFVKIGTTLRFYTQDGLDLASEVALAAIVDGAGAPVVETIVGTGQNNDVYNYVLFRRGDDDEFFAQFLAVGRSPSRALVIALGGGDLPDQVSLCTAPTTCQGRHTCNGLLGVLDNETDIVSLSCRGYQYHPPIDTRYGSDDKNPLFDIADELDTTANRIFALLRTDPATAEKTVDSLPQGSMAFMHNHKGFLAWEKARHLKDFASQKDYVQLVGHLKANWAYTEDIEDIAAWVRTAPGYETIVFTALRDPNCQKEFEKVDSLDVFQGFAAALDEAVAIPERADEEEPVEVEGDDASVESRKSPFRKSSGPTTPVSSGGASPDDDDIVYEEGEVEELGESDDSTIDSFNSESDIDGEEVEGALDPATPPNPLTEDQQAQLNAEVEVDSDPAPPPGPPTADEQAQINYENEQAVMSIQPGVPIGLAVNDGVVAIGSEHTEAAWAYATKGEVATIEAPKGVFSKKLLVVHGILEPDNRGLVTELLKMWSEGREIRFEE
jgi:hypothetical protein